MTATTSLPRLLTAREVAKETGLPKATVYKLTRRGELPAVRVGTRGYRYAATAVRQWVERGGTRPEPASAETAGTSGSR